MSVADQVPTHSPFHAKSTGAEVLADRDLAGTVARHPMHHLGGFFAKPRPLQDRKALQTGQPLLKQLELHLYPSRDVGWCLTSKLPLLKSDGKVLGLVGVSQDLRLPDSSAAEFQHVLAAVTYAEKNVSQAPTVDELAAVAEMSRFQLDSRMRRVFGLTTGQWLLKLRIDCAERLLTESNDAIADIARQSGY